MSYLKSFEYKRRVTRGALGALNVYGIQWRGTRGQIFVSKTGAQGPGDDTGAVYYARYSTIGKLLSRNAESERHFIAVELRKQNDYAGMKFSFVSV